MANEERVTIDPDDSPSAAFIRRNRCCFHFPSATASASSFWDRIRAADGSNRWWARPFQALKRLREWSEIVAGPKWKTFIRRFNRHRNNHHHHQPTGKFQYDPLSYALNFDEGPGQNGQFVDDFNNGHYPDFSSRFAAIPLSSKSSMDLGNGALDS